MTKEKHSTISINCSSQSAASFLISDAPGAPTKPVISNIQETSATVTWSPPISDGGSPITSYTVELKDSFSPRWVVVEKEMFTECSVTLKKLREGTEYMVRVTAENKAGLGKPSEPSTAFIAKAPYGM